MHSPSEILKASEYIGEKALFRSGAVLIESEEIKPTLMGRLFVRFGSLIKNICARFE